MVAVNAHIGVAIKQFIKQFILAQKMEVEYVNFRRIVPKITKYNVVIFGFLDPSIANFYQM